MISSKPQLACKMNPMHAVRDIKQETNESDGVMKDPRRGRLPQVLVAVAAFPAPVCFFLRCRVAVLFADVAVALSLLPMRCSRTQSRLDRSIVLGSAIAFLRLRASLLTSPCTSRNIRHPHRGPSPSYRRGLCRCWRPGSRRCPCCTCGSRARCRRKRRRRVCGTWPRSR